MAARILSNAAFSDAVETGYRDGLFEKAARKRQVVPVFLRDVIREEEMA